MDVWIEPTMTLNIYLSPGIILFTRQNRQTALVAYPDICPTHTCYINSL